MWAILSYRRRALASRLRILSRLRQGTKRAGVEPLDGQSKQNKTTAPRWTVIPTLPLPSSHLHLAPAPPPFYSGPHDTQRRQSNSPVCRRRLAGIHAVNYTHIHTQHLQSSASTHLEAGHTPHLLCEGPCSNSHNVPSSSTDRCLSSYLVTGAARVGLARALRSALALARRNSLGVVLDGTGQGRRRPELVKGFCSGPREAVQYRDAPADSPLTSRWEPKTKTLAAASFLPCLARPYIAHTSHLAPSTPTSLLTSVAFSPSLPTFIFSPFQSFVCAQSAIRVPRVSLCFLRRLIGRASSAVYRLSNLGLAKLGPPALIRDRESLSNTRGGDNNTTAATHGLRRTSRPRSSH
ncbi:hypothetical protein FALBO_4063 [Fusarium albosuccineum]|uniref:Uncharacterized protein n=1 Tax=Fusarium albosuccineum TaxID=1237068 RepID=A0A8H4LHB5_9HYPO|nr:hypothetical protein FALBO_4063 [Fusarium albosuccineum]